MSGGLVAEILGEALAGKEVLVVGLSPERRRLGLLGDLCRELERVGVDHLVRRSRLYLQLTGGNQVRIVGGGVQALGYRADVAFNLGLPLSEAFWLGPDVRSRSL